jgi:hypothetical protein
MLLVAAVSGDWASRYMDSLWKPIERACIVVGTLCSVGVLILAAGTYYGWNAPATTPTAPVPAMTDSWSPWVISLWFFGISLLATGWVMIFTRKRSLSQPLHSIKEADEPANSKLLHNIKRTIESDDGNWQFDSQMAASIAARLRSTPGWQHKIIVDITPEYLWGLFHGHTSVQGDNLAEPFLNKWMVVCGPFGDLTSSASQKLLTFTFRADSRIVLMYFNEGLQEPLALMIPKQKIAVVGRIYSVNKLRLILEDCESLWKAPCIQSIDRCKANSLWSRRLHAQS